MHIGSGCYLVDCTKIDKGTSIILHKLDLERLFEVLSKIPVKEREFIQDCFNAEWGSRKQIAEKYGMTLGAIKQKKRRIVEKIRKLFFKTEKL